MAKYCHGIDKKDEATFLSIWDENGVYELPRGKGTGKAGIKELLHKVWRQVPKCHHHITNPVIDIDGDYASAVSDVFYYRESDNGLLQLLSGTYDFEFVKKSGEWSMKKLKFSSFATISPIFKENIEA
ncbi:nuclear transport factor 2 family protein [Oceanobacillus sp. J11TS1]|uniref:nuclear transport factor 2 family protein n=1 Tax=Oceanobacillus sp. J11TS1 TaxID=2807191 RepID=UPI001B28EC23|nr:nuclear transport factor 2 family protein [Oceanobacillus sp. J11TS1]GIO22102.1 hypothetical protein J11TS1_06830 [Oceanobacillus sp. J11TS1]